MGDVPSTSNASIRESTGSYSFQHNEMSVVSGIVQSTQDPGKSADITEKLNSMIYIHVGMDTLTIDSAKLNEYVGYDVDQFVVKELHLTISYKATASGTMTNTQWSVKLNQCSETTRTLYLNELGGNPEQTIYHVTSDDPENFKGGELMIDQDQKKAGFSYTIAFPNELVELHVNLTYDNVTGEWSGYGYGFGYEVNFIQIKMHQSFENRITNNPNIQYLYPDNKKQTLVFIYGAGSDNFGPTTQRATEVVKRSIERQGQDNNINVIFLGIEDNPETDLANLEMLYQRGHTLFFSSIGSNTVSYLADLFFDKKPSGTYHINSLSTASNLSSKPNLMRLTPPDVANIPVFTALTPSENVIIIKGVGPWEDGISTAIYNSLTAENKTVATYTIGNDVSTDGYVVTDEYDQLLADNFQDNDVTIIIIHYNGTDLTAQLNDRGFFTNNVNNYNLLYGDATKVGTVDNSLYQVLNKGNASVVVPFVTPLDVKLFKELTVNIPDFDFPYVATSYFSMINIASNLYDIPLADRSEYSVAANIKFDAAKDNATAYYSIIGWKTLDTSYIKTLFLAETDDQSEISIYRCDIVA